jgi:hypothetical protein
MGQLLYPEKVAEVVLSGDGVWQGALIGYSNGWKLADSSASANIYAQYIALNGGNAGDEIKVCKKCMRYDENTPYIVDSTYYLSPTAGLYTATRPVDDGDMIQIVGRSIDTTRMLIDITPPQEFKMFISPDTYDTTGEPGLGTTDTGWVGPQVDAAGELVFFKGRFPSGIISVDVVRVIYNSINASAYDTDVTVVRAFDGAANDQDTGTTIIADDFDIEDADNKILYQTITSAFDTDFVKPNASFCVKLDPDAITGDVQVIGLYIRGLKC